MSSPKVGKKVQPSFNSNEPSSQQVVRKDPILAQDILGCLQFLESEMGQEPRDTIKEVTKAQIGIPSPTSKIGLVGGLTTIQPGYEPVVRSNYNSVMSSNSSYSHVKSLQGLDSQDDDTLVAKMYDLYEKLKHRSSTESRPTVLEEKYEEEEDEIEIEDDYADELAEYPARNQINEESYFDFEQDKLRRQDIVQKFLERTKEYQLNKHQRLQQSRQDQINDFKRNQESIWTNKPKIRVVVEEGQQLQQNVTPKKTRYSNEEQLPSREIQLYQELSECTFKPTINQNSIALASRGVRSHEEFYQDMMAKKNHKRQANLETQNEEEQQKIVEGLTQTNRGGGGSSTGTRAANVKNILNEKSSSFLERLDSDIQKRALKKMELQAKCSPSFSPMIYENFRPQNLILQMQEEKSLYRMSKINQEESLKNKQHQHESNYSASKRGEENRNNPIGSSAITKLKQTKTSNSVNQSNLSYSQTLKKPNNPSINTPPFTSESQIQNQQLKRSNTTSAKQTKQDQSPKVELSKSKDNRVNKLNVSNSPSEKDQFKSFLQNNILQLKSSLNPKQ